MAFLTKGLRITIEDKRVNEEENETPKKADFCFEGGLKSFVEFLNKNKETLHKTPIYIEKTDGKFLLKLLFNILQVILKIFTHSLIILIQLKVELT